MASSPKTGEKRKATAISAEPLIDIVDIDPNGDLILVIGADLAGKKLTLMQAEKPAAFRVDYKTLARHSSIQPIQPQADPANQSRAPSTFEAGGTLRLPKASPTGWEFLLRLAHGQVGKVPEQQTFQDIYEILCTAFDTQMLPLLKDRIPSWFSSAGDATVVPPLQCDFTDATSAIDLAKAHRIGFHLGNESLITKVWKHIIFHSTLMPAPNCLLAIQGMPLNTPKLQIQPFLLAFLKAQRLQILKALVDAMVLFVQQLEGTQDLPLADRCPHHRGQGDRQKLCAALALGSLSQSLAAKGNHLFWPLWAAECINVQTVQELVTAWTSIELKGLSDTVTPSKRMHKCDWTSVLRKRVQAAAVFEITWPENVKADVARQAARMGLESL
ncbi:hypothetical protein PG995_004309 [Apiospora arundinis]